MAKSSKSGKPNILFIMGDDIGWFNVSAYNMGMLRYRTPNIDRIGKEGAAFITGHIPGFTGLDDGTQPRPRRRRW